MNDALQQVEQREAAFVPLPQLRMDRSRTFATVNGERAPDSRYHAVQFIQDGLMFDAQGFCIIEHPDHQKPGRDGDKLRKMLERRLEKAAKQQAKEKPRRQRAPVGMSFDSSEDEDESDQADADEDGEDEDDDLAPINLEAWLRGEQDVEWQEVTQEVARRFKKRIANLPDAVVFLCKEMPFPKAQLRQKFQKHLD